jgi:hypothetical protein
MACEAFRIQFGEYPPDNTADAAVFLQKAFPKAKNLPVPSVDPSTALHYWLAGPNDKGFSANPLDPFDNSPNRIGPFFDFDRTRVVGHQFFPDNGSKSAFVYFCAKNGKYTGSCQGATSDPAANPTSFQIWMPGPDGTFGDQAQTNFRIPGQ